MDRSSTLNDMAWVPGGTFQMGSDNFYPEERPVHRVTVGGFWIDLQPVTNAEFRRFVEATGYVTVPERAPDPAEYPEVDPSLLVPGSLVFRRPPHRVSLKDHRAWWAYVPGACWRHPDGPASTVEDREDHPVVHVAYEDAEAYAAWSGKSLPSEAEWEFAARGGLKHAAFVWGDEFMPGGKIMANTWQGAFPHENLKIDGYDRTSPVTAFPPNGHGVYDMIGNVWEWTADWYGVADAATQAASPCCAPRNPRGGDEAGSIDPRDGTHRFGRKVLKGGSHLCAENYCRRYRPAARHAQPVDSSTSHIGFRCAADA